MASSILPPRDDQAIQLDYAKAAKSVGVEMRKVAQKVVEDSRSFNAKYFLSREQRRVAKQTSERDAIAVIKRRSAAVEPLKCEQFEKFNIGSETYKFHNSITVEFNSTGNGFTAHLASLNLQEFNGFGDSSSSARSNLFQRIHKHFQQLYKTQPMQRSDAQETIWSKLKKLIDVEHYKFNRSTLLTCRGQVSVNEDSDVVFDWLGGSTLNLPAELLSAGWGALEDGQWCKALIERRSGDGKIRQAIMLCKVAPPAEISDEEAASSWNDLPAAKLHLPD